LWYNGGMRKFLGKIKHRLKVLAILVILVASMSFLAWVSDTDGKEYALTWVAVIIAAIAALAALGSLQVTRDSLVLTRTTTRPFLTLEKAEYNPHMPEVVLYICNTGALPGDKVLVEIFFLQSISDMLPITAAIEYPLPSIFPNEEKIVAAVLNPDMVNYINSGEEARIFVTIKYRSLEKECNTRRMLRWPSGREYRQHP